MLPLVAVGGRITGYLARDIDLTRRGCRVTISQVRVQASSDCSYYPHETALVPVITVVDPEAASSSSCRDDASEASRIALSKVHMTDAVHKRIASHLSRRSDCQSSSSDSAASSSHRRRFADIRECLDEQECVDLLESNGDDENETQEALASDKSAHYGDATSRSQFLAALRAKRARAVAASTRSLVAPS